MPVDLAGIPGRHRQPDLEPGTACPGLPQAPPPALIPNPTPPFSTLKNLPHPFATHPPPPASSQIPRSQSRRECPAVPPRQLALQPRLPLLRRHPRTLLLCLEQPRRPALDNHVNRIARLGTAVLINGTWYKPSPI